MRYRTTGKKHKIYYVITTVKIVFFTIFYGFLIFGGFFTGSLIVSALTDSLPLTNPTLVPTVHEEHANNEGWLDRLRQ
jgi:hypothetical protein